MRLTDTKNSLLTDMATLMSEGFFDSGRFGGIEFNESPRTMADYKGHIIWKNKEPYNFRLDFKVKKFGIVEATFAIGAYYEYFDHNSMNTHKFVLVYTEGDDNTALLAKNIKALANLTVAQADLNT